MKMIPCTSEVWARMISAVVEVMIEHGLVERSEDAERMTDEAMAVFRSQGLIDDDGNVIVGRCLFLPSTEGEIKLLFPAPCPADQFDEHLRRRPSPIKFRRTVRDEILIPARFLAARLEELAENPSAPQELRRRASHLWRCGALKDIVLPPEADTLAMTVVDHEGSAETLIEAVPAGHVVTLEETR